MTVQAIEVTSDQHRLAHLELAQLVRLHTGLTWIAGVADDQASSCGGDLAARSGQLHHGFEALAEVAGSPHLRGRPARLLNRIDWSMCSAADWSALALEAKLMIDALAAALRCEDTVEAVGNEGEDAFSIRLDPLDRRGPVEIQITETAEGD